MRLTHGRLIVDAERPKGPSLPEEPLALSPYRTDESVTLYCGVDCEMGFKPGPHLRSAQCDGMWQLYQDICTVLKDDALASKPSPLFSRTAESGWAYGDIIPVKRLSMTAKPSREGLCSLRDTIDWVNYNK